MRDLGFLGLTGLREVALHDTQGHEFFVALRMALAVPVPPRALWLQELGFQRGLTP